MMLGSPGRCHSRRR